jgi:hypothetical protein
VKAEALPRPDWHCVWMDETPEGFEVRCIPHGPVGVREHYLEAFVLGLQHDHDSGGGCL